MKLLFNSLKLLFAIALVVELVLYVGGGEVWKVFLNLDWQYILLLVAMSLLLIFISCLKWQFFIQQQGNQVSVFYLMRLYTIAYFFNMFAPSSLGGDAIRSFKLGKFLGSQTDAFAATFLERVSGMIAMCLLAMLALVLGAGADFKVSLALICIPVLVFTISCFVSSARNFLFLLLERIAPLKFQVMLAKVKTATEYASGNKKLLFGALGFSLLFHSLAVVNVYISCLAMGWSDPSFADLFVVLPMILILGMLPITPNGIGLQEGAFMYFLKSIGTTSSVGLGVGLLLRAKVILLAILGGILYCLPDKHDVQ